MNASLILENLEKLDKIHQFISLLEIKFSDQEMERKKIKSIKKLLEYSLTDLAFSINEKLKDDQVSPTKQAFTSTKISEILNICDEASFIKENKNFLFLTESLYDIEVFLRNWELKQNPIFINGHNAEIAKLKEKILIIISERII